MEQLLKLRAVRFNGKDSSHKGTNPGQNPELMHLLEEGYLCIMIYSGSRHLGKEICDYFHKKARELNKTWYSQVPEEYRLRFFRQGQR